MTDDRFGFEDDPPPDRWDAAFDARLDAMRAQIQAITARYIESAKEKAGRHYETMQRGPRETERFLDHPDPDLRLAAMTMFGARWGSDERWRAACERMAWTEGDDEVRAAAISALGWHYE